MELEIQRELEEELRLKKQAELGRQTSPIIIEKRVVRKQNSLPTNFTFNSPPIRRSPRPILIKQRAVDISTSSLPTASPPLKLGRPRLSCASSPTFDSSADDECDAEVLAITGRSPTPTFFIHPPPSFESSGERYSSDASLSSIARLFADSDSVPNHETI